MNNTVHKKNVPTLVAQGISFHQKGQLGQAKDLYEQVLSIDASHFNALYLTGIIYAQTHSPELAVDYLSKAIAVKADFADAYYNRGLMLDELRRLDEALASYDQTVALQPSYFLAYNNRGNVLLELSRPDDALLSFEKAIEVKPDFAQAHSNRGNVLKELGRYEEALTSYDSAIKYQPDYAEAYYNRGVVLRHLLRYTEALDSYDKATVLSKNSAHIHVNRGIVLEDLGRSVEALSSYERAIEINPEFAEAYYNRGVLLQDLGRLQEALGNYDLAIAIKSDYAQAYWNKSLALLQSEQYAQGWDLYERRWQAEDFVSARLSFTQPMWGGERSDNKLLIWAEQGVGDQVLYGGLLPELAGYPQHKVVALDKRLIPLFERSMPGLEFVGFNRIAEILDFAEQIPMGSLPRLLRPSKESFEKVKSPYLMADQVRVESLRPLIARAGKRVCGVSWLSKNTKFGQHKSLSLEQMLLPLKGEGLHFVNLQYGDTQEEREALQREHGIEVQDVQAVDNYNDIDGLAALIEACDVVLTTSNTTAHLAGALGKETLLLLPYGRGRLWYWSRKGAEQDGQGERSNGNNGDRSVWYPSIRIYTQDQPGQWQGALADIRSYLEIKSWTPSRSS